ncbi:MAG: YlmC/YmxH family sporulation protein [Clostridia bacterium]|nr:YlmC/YmxH family sporulation protein [Clostridia bacterium]
MGCTIEELCRKEVINVETADRVGFIGDVEVDVNTGCLVCICVFPVGRGFFRPPQPLKISWCDILKIGEETVLVKNVPPLPPAPPNRMKKTFAGLFGK